MARSFRLTRRELNAAHQFTASFCQDPEKRAQYEARFVKPPKADRIRRPADKHKPVTASEHQEQRAVIDWWGLVHEKYGLPLFALFAVPNGGARDAITGALLKAEGVRPGALDLILAKPNETHAGLFIEMKVGSNKPSDTQEAFITYLRSVGYKASVHWNAGSAIEAIEIYLGAAPV